MKENKGECNPVLDRILKTLRIRCLKQIELARHLGINEVAFTKWKNGENTSFMRHIDAIAGFLHVDKEYLLYGTNAEESLLDLHPDEIEQLKKICMIPEENRKVIYDMIETIWALTYPRKTER